MWTNSSIVDGFSSGVHFSITDNKIFFGYGSVIVKRSLSHAINQIMTGARTKLFMTRCRSIVECEQLICSVHTYLFLPNKIGYRTLRSDSNRFRLSIRLQISSSISLGFDVSNWSILLICLRLMTLISGSILLHSPPGALLVILPPNGIV